MVTSVSRGRPYRRIATEEAWIGREILALYQEMLEEGSANDPGYDSLWRHPEEVAAMERMPLTDADKKAFFQSNAERVFKL